VAEGEYQGHSSANPSLGSNRASELHRGETVAIDAARRYHPHEATEIPQIPEITPEATKYRRTDGARNGAAAGTDPFSGSWREVLEGGAGGRCWREVLEGGAGGRCWREVLEGGAGGRCWREMTEIPRLDTHTHTHTHTHTDREIDT
jgi:hypothetical protein